MRSDPQPRATGTSLPGIVLLSVLVSTWCVSGRPARAGPEGMLETKVKTAYLFNFVKFVEWPSDEGASSAAAITICVIGTDPVAGVVEQLAGRQVKGRPLVVEHHPREQTRFLNCQILFVSQSEERRLPELLQEIPSTGVLTVSDIAQFCRRGGVIGFVFDEGRIKIEINLRTARQSGLKISAKLLEVAKVIQ